MTSSENFNLQNKIFKLFKQRPLFEKMYLFLSCPYRSLNKSHLFYHISLDLYVTTHFKIEISIYLCHVFVYKHHVLTLIYFIKCGINQEEMYAQELI